MSDNFVKIDLHVHTPISKFYKGKTDDTEYFSILRNAIGKNIKVIAITDHNTIDGYKKLFSIKEDLEKKVENLAKITDSNQSITKTNLLKKDIDLFSKILIFLGVEIE